MIKLKAEINTSSLNLSNEICSSFDYNIMFHTTPNSNFLTTHYIIDFYNKELIEIKTDYGDNDKRIEDINPKILESIPHSISAINDKGFYVFPNNSSVGLCFKYIDYKGNVSVLFGSDLNHPESKYWKRVSASFQASPDTQYMIIGFHREDNNSVDVVKVDDNLNAELIFNIPNMLDAPHEMIEIDDFILSTTFRLFEAYNTTTGKFYRWPEDIVKDGYDFDSPPKDIKISPGQLFSYNKNTDEVVYLTVDAPPTAHFIKGKNQTFYSTAHNMTFYKDKFHFFGPAQLTKWNIEDGEIIKENVFIDKHAYRCTTYIHFIFENKEYLVTLAYPNRLIFIDNDTMDIVHYHDIDDDLLTNINDVKKHVNYIHRSNHPADKYCLNDINISSDGKYVLYFEKDRVNFYDFKNRKVVEEGITFPVDAASKIETLRAVMHTGILNQVRESK